MQNDINKKSSDESELRSNNRSPLEQSMEQGLDSKSEESPPPSSPPPSFEESEAQSIPNNDSMSSPENVSNNELPVGLGSTPKQEAEFNSGSEIKEETKPLEPMTEEQPEAVSSTPDTDQFLKSIMEEDSSLPDDTQILPNSPTTSEEPSAEAKIDEIQPKTKEKSFNLDELKTEDPITEPMSKEDFAPNNSPVDNQAEKASSVNLDSIKKPEEEEDQSDSLIQSSAIKKRKTGTSPIKLILAILLSVAIVALGYYAYSVFFPGTTELEMGEYDDTYDSNFSSLETATIDETDSFQTLDEQRKSDLSQISNALLSYYNEFGVFPTSEKLTLLNSGNVLEYALVPGHLKQMPYDPNPANSYGYKSDGSTFTLSAILDDSSDSQAVIESGKAIYYLEYPSSQDTVTTDSVLSENLESDTSLNDDSLVPEEDQSDLLNL